MRTEGKETYIDPEVVEQIAEHDLDPLDELPEEILEFRAFFKAQVGSFHFLPCRVCGSFIRKRVLFLDDEDPHKAVSLCLSHYNRFLNFYFKASGIPREGSLEFQRYPEHENVIHSLCVDDGKPFCDTRPFYGEDEWEWSFTCDLSKMRLDLGRGERECAIKRTKYKRKIRDNDEVAIALCEESPKAYGLAEFPFDFPYPREFHE